MRTPDDQRDPWKQIPFEYGLRRDEDGWTWLYSDDPQSIGCAVTVSRHGADGSHESESHPGGEGGVNLPSLFYREPLSAWFIDGACGVEVASSDGKVLLLRACGKSQET